MLEKFKYFLQNDQLFYGLIVILVAIASFALGRASVEVGGMVSQIPQVALLPTQLSGSNLEVSSTKETTETRLVGSKSGTKYHEEGCPGAKQIKEENKVFFNSVAEAEAAGYKRAANCPSLP